MVGCDLHDKNMLLKMAVGRGKPEKRSFANTPSGRKAMLADLEKRSLAADGAEVIFAYEASCQGFGLYDEIAEAGHECHVPAAKPKGFVTKYVEVQIDPKARATVKPGKNMLAVYCRQTGGGQGIDVGIVEVIRKKLAPP